MFFRRSLHFCMPLSLLAFAMLPAWGGQEDQIFPIDGEYAASHILVSYMGARLKPKDVTRSEAEAEARAKELLARVKRDPSLFDQLARSESDDSSAVFAGFIGGFEKRDLAGKFVRAVRRLDIGEIRSEVLHTKFGFHIIRREPLLLKHYRAGVLLVACEKAGDVEDVPHKVTGTERSCEDARTRIDNIKGLLEETSFSELVKQYSDWPEPEIPLFHRGDSPFFDVNIEDLETVGYGEVTDIVSTALGYALFLRKKVEKFNARRIIVAHRYAKDAPHWVDLKRSEAWDLAREILTKLKADPDRFEELAKEHSSGVFAGRGGLMISWFGGTRAEHPESVVESYDLGQISEEPIEADQGYIIFKRIE